MIRIFTVQHFWLEVFDQDQISLKITRHHATALDSFGKLAKRLRFSLDFCQMESLVKAQVTWPGKGLYFLIWPSATNE